MNSFYYTGCFDDFIRLDATESNHCVKVLRLRRGDTVFVTDGKGTMAEAEIAEPDALSCLLRVKNISDSSELNTPAIHLAVSLLHNTDRFEWLTEKATELGVAEITPLAYERTLKRKINYARINKIMISALKQSLGAYLPVFNNLTDFGSFVKTEFNCQKAIAFCSGSSTGIAGWYRPGGDCLVLIGPEGDFTEDEINLTLSMGYARISLGRSRLRTETAAVAACMAFNLLNKL